MRWPYRIAIIVALVLSLAALGVSLRPREAPAPCFPATVWESSPSVTYTDSVAVVTHLRDLQWELDAFKLAFESDLASGDATFHWAHEAVDRREW